MAVRGVAVATFFLLATSAYSQTTIPVTELVPTTFKVSSLATVGPGLGATPTAPTRRRMNELVDLPYGEDVYNSGRQLQSLPGTEAYGAAVDVPAAFIETVLTDLNYSDSEPNTGRRRLLDAAAPLLVIYGLAKHQILDGTVSVTYIFNEDAAGFLDIVTQSVPGSYEFKRAVLDFPQEQVNGNVPPYVNSEDGFLSSNPALHPYFVKLQTQNPTGFVPNLGIRFDYEAPSPFTRRYSLYFTDLVAGYPAGLPEPALSQTAGIFLGNDKVFTSNQK